VKKLVQILVLISSLGSNFTFAADEALLATTNPNSQPKANQEVAKGLSRKAILVNALCGIFARNSFIELYIRYFADPAATAGLRAGLGSPRCNYGNCPYPYLMSGTFIIGRYDKIGLILSIPNIIKIYYGYHDERKKLLRGQQNNPQVVSIASPILRGVCESHGRAIIADVLAKLFQAKQDNPELFQVKQDIIGLGLAGLQTLAQISGKYYEDVWIEFGRSLAHLQKKIKETTLSCCAYLQNSLA